MEYLLGIDGGGTRTTAWLADTHLSILSRIETGPTNPVKVGMASVQRELARAFRLALREARLRPVKLRTVCAGLAGSDSAPVHKPLLAWLRKSIPARAHLLTTDAMITLAAGLGESDGVVVIAGTGSIAFGRDKQGRVLRVGGWGSLFGDAGSGYDVGRKAVVCALRALDGSGNPTKLTDSICRELQLERISEIVAKPLTPQHIAALFPAVQKTAIAGDRVARGLLKEASRDLSDLALAVIAQFGWVRSPVPVICSGGVFQSSPMIRREFTRRVHESAPKARVSSLRRQPVEGALFLASKLAQTAGAKLK